MEQSSTYKIGSMTAWLGLVALVVASTSYGVGWALWGVAALVGLGLLVTVVNVFFDAVESKPRESGIVAAITTVGNILCISLLLMHGHAVVAGLWLAAKFLVVAKIKVSLRK